MAKFKKPVPFKDLLFLQERIGRVFDEALSRYQGYGESVCTWSPPSDIFETPDSLVVKVELPGVNKEDIDIEVKETMLLIRGERKVDAPSDNTQKLLASNDSSNSEDSQDTQDSQDTDDTIYRMECSYGLFERAFFISEDIDPNNITATIEDGVLSIVLPKCDVKNTKTLKVTVS